ncbi:MAG: transketolase [Verrucomicrobiota bacterium]
MERMPFTAESYNRLAAEFRHIITEIICRSGSGHLGGCLSLVEIIITLYWRILRVNPTRPQWEDRDRFVLSKGHAGPLLYTALACRGYFPVRELSTLNADGTFLPSHCDMLRTPGVDMTAGSLGQGLSAAVGMAIGAKMDNKDFKVFCVIGDGESDEGQIWEAALFAGYHKLDNLIVITDYNKLQIDGFTRDVLDLEPLADKWRAFNWDVSEMNGHCWDDIYQTVMTAAGKKGKPKMIIAHTIKAKGHCLFENKPESHNIKVPDQQSYHEFVSVVKAPGFLWPCK